MKTIMLSLILALAFSFSYSQEETQTEKAEFKVYGNCGMCKKRIEKAAKIEGVSLAVWDEKTKIMKVEFIKEKVSVEAIHKNIAKIGHDTEKEKAEDAVYEKLHSCCKYKRRIAAKE